MPTYEDYDRDYHSEDRDEVLGNIKQYGTDDRSKWGAPQNAPAPQQANNWGAPQQKAFQGVPDQQKTMGAPASGGAWDRTAFRDAWMGSGVNTVGGMEQWLASNPQLSQGVQIVGPKRDKLQLPTGEIIDGIYAAGLGGGQGGPMWTGSGGTQNGVPVTSGGPPSAPGPMVNGAAGGGAGMPGGLKGELYQTLMDRMKQAQTVNRNDPAIRPQADAYSAEQERSSRNYMADLAEKSGPTANLRGEGRMAAERQGQASGAFEAQLMGRELTAKRDQIQQALSQLGSSLNQDEALALQRELGYLNNAIQQQQIGLGLRGLDQQWQSTLLNNEQFNKDLGLRAEDRSSYWDAVRTGLV